ncbi:MAG: sugar transferase [Planctomycetaceae bacterium]|nr:sugar transferase [Planctomycetaceae bacterium]
MIRRLFDIVASATALFILWPLMAAAAVGVKLSSPGPAFYRAQRVGQNGRLFTMYKLRTMHCRQTAGSSITAADDPRVFRLGRLLRAIKIDELPQLWNILIGDMAVVGPRPEAPDIVDRYYTDEYRETLSVRPGLTSPGSLIYYLSGEDQLTGPDAEQHYIDVLLPAKMTAERDYLRRQSVVSDLEVVLRTAWVLAGKIVGRAPQASGVDPDAPQSVPGTHTNNGPEQRNAA